MSSQVWVGKDANFESYEQLRAEVKSSFASGGAAVEHLKDELKAQSEEGSKISAMHAIEFARIRLNYLVEAIKEAEQVEAAIAVKEKNYFQKINQHLAVKVLHDEAQRQKEKDESLIKLRKKHIDLTQELIATAKADYEFAVIKRTVNLAELTKQCDTLRLALTATYAYGTAEIACNYYLALQFLTNEKRIGNTQWFYTILSYFNFSRLTIFKLLDGVTQIAGSNTPAPLDLFLNQMSIAGAALYGVRILADVFFVINAAHNRDQKLLPGFIGWWSAAWIALQKDNRHHRIANNALWFAIMVVRLTCVEMMKNVSTYVFCAGYLIDLLQNLWKASTQLKDLQALRNQLADDTSAEALALDQKIIDTRAELWKDSGLYTLAYLGTLLGALGFFAKSLAVGSTVIAGTALAFTPLAIAITGLLLALVPLYLVYGKELFTAKHIGVLKMAIGATLLVGIGLSVLLFVNPFTMPVTIALCVGAVVLGLLFTGGAQAIFTCNKERIQRLWSMNDLGALVIPALALGAMLYIAFFPASMAATIGVTVAAFFVTLLAKYLTNKHEKPVAKNSAKSLEDIPEESQFIKGMKPMRSPFFEQKADRVQSRNSTSPDSSDSERMFDPDSPSSTRADSPVTTSPDTSSSFGAAS